MWLKYKNASSDKILITNCSTLNMLWPQMLIPTLDLNLQGTLTTSLLRMASNSICTI